MGRHGFPNQPPDGFDGPANGARQMAWFSAAASTRQSPVEN